MVDEYTAVGERYEPSNMLLPGKDFERYLARLEEIAQGVRSPADRVPMNTYWLVREQKTLVGTVYIRWRLTPFLENEGGHIGYKVRPSERRKGYGTRLLALALDRLREHGLRRVMITCDTDNVASARIIKKNGGRFKDETVSFHSKKPVSRYWIKL